LDFLAAAFFVAFCLAAQCFIPPPVSFLTHFFASSRPCIVGRQARSQVVCLVVFFFFFVWRRFFSARCKQRRLIARYVNTATGNSDDHGC
jgi:hypothetical protein